MKDEEVVECIAVAEGQKGVAWGEPLAVPLAEADVDYMLGMALRRVRALEAQVARYKQYIAQISELLVDARNFERTNG